MGERTAGTLEMKMAKAKQRAVGNLLNSAREGSIPAHLRAQPHFDARDCC
jgi:hypothetical protein